MDQLLKIQRKLVPDIMEKMYRRHHILNTIQLHEPIGRRALSELLNLTERVLRSEVELLHRENLVEVNPKGMRLTHSGKEIVDALSQLMASYNSMKFLGDEIASHYNIDKVIIASGNADTDSAVMDQLGFETSRYLHDIVNKDMTVSVTGGSTMVSVARQLTPFKYHLTFTPARGGLGEDVLYQANAVAGQMAKQVNGEYHVLYVPDQVSDEAYAMLTKEPSIQRVLSHIRHADIIIHGIGDAMKLAERRNTTADILEFLKVNHAAAEAFGYYFDEAGNVIHRVKTIGLQLEDLSDKPYIIAVAGGETKKKAIEAYLKVAPHNTVLITDEMCAVYLAEAFTKKRKV